MNKEAPKNQGLKMRAPVVVVMGHVDHGKTKLLDVIRKTNVIEKESGGITQHIGAYQTTANGKPITFLDTPGHEAFTAIRSRGANVADIAILVIAADESVKPQTKEAIKIILQAGIPYIVAINKIDREGSNPQKVKQDLAAESVLVEEWGGQVPVVEISAKQEWHIKELLDMVLLVAEMEELNEDLSSPASGVIIESNLSKGKGYVATTLVQKGILKLGDWLVSGSVVCKIKSMEDFTGKTVREASPSMPVQLAGWSDAPEIGKDFLVAKDKGQAEELAAKNRLTAPEALFIKSDAMNKKILNAVVKCDVTSSLEAIDLSLRAIKSEEIGYNILAHGIGTITEADIRTALSSNAIVFGFRVDIEGSARKMAEKESIKILSYDIIYELIESFRNEMAELLEPETSKVQHGKLRVLALFKKEGKNQIIGGKVTSGKLVRGALVDINDKRMGKITQLQQAKTDVSEVREGLECGLRVELFDTDKEIKVGDILEVYEEQVTKRTL